MNKFIRWFGLLCAVEMCTLCAHAQERELARAAMDAFGKDLPANAGKILSKGVETALGENLTKALTQDMINAQLNAQVTASLLKLESSFMQQNKEARNRFHANAFLIETKYKGKREVWGVTAAELLHGYGDNLVLRANINGKEVSFPAEVAAQGPRAISNIALLRVPQDLPAGLKPLSLSRTYNFNEPVAVFGYKKEDLFSLQNLSLQKDNGLFMRMDFSNVKFSQSGPFGGPVLSNGKLVGVYCNRSLSGGYASSIRTLPFLIEAAHEGTSEFPVQMHGILFGTIHPTEVILVVQALDVRLQVIGQKTVTKQLHQSDVFKLFNNPDTHFIRFLLEDREGDPYNYSPKHKFRILTYDKKYNISWVTDKKPTSGTKKDPLE